MGNLLHNLYTIYQRLKLLKFLHKAAYKCFLTATLAYSVIFLAKRSGISYKTILNVMIKVRNSRQMVGNLTNLLRKNIGLNNDEKEEENNENNDENSGGRHWVFRQINEQTNGFFENFLSSNGNKEKFRRRRKKRRDELLGTINALLIMFGLLIALRWLIMFCITPNQQLNAANARSALRHSAQIGEAHMAAFDQIADITVGDGSSSTSSASGQQNQQKGDDAHQCAICLLEIEPGTVIKQLPACQHSFHMDCIKIWLKGYNNFCPLCRAKIFTEYKDGKVELNTQKQNYGTFDENV
ncbi:hypothetical protein niasHT_014171 [Heterodera trifolii]|uniref:RING-type domain-containing protein n=1 Tax=Heterodera trifolii TaxID=157864 RepID=A0ABD2KYW3_9BILA